MKKKKTIINILIVIIFMIGLGIALYPTVSDIYGKYRDSKLITKYEKSVDKLSVDKKAELLQDAVDYNSNLVSTTGSGLVTKLQHKDYNTEEELSNYNKQLSSNGSALMGTISIPSIAVTIPIYHWSDDSVLEKGIGHIHGSSLPVGNGVDPESEEFSNIQGSHCLLIGHRGLPSYKLFSDLDEVEVGDVFYLNVLNKVYAYKVYDVETVLPTEVDSLKIEPGRDLCTLITCTPYGVNTHRILVKGERIPYKGESTEAPMTKKIINTVDTKTVFGICFIVFLIFIMFFKGKNKKNKKQKGTIGEINETKEVFSDSDEHINSNE